MLTDNSPAEPRPWRLAAIWLLALGPFFFLTYGFANWVTSRLAHVPSFAFGWERAVPFLPWTIVPYWSTDLLYAVSLFLCTTRRELMAHARRLLTAQILCVTGFLLFPLQFSFTRPAVDGLFGWLFQVLTGFDPPFNEAPSLHLALTVILWARYSAHMRGMAWWAMRGWLVLTGVSAMTTYQHHFIDLPTGIAVGLLAMALFPMPPVPASAQGRRLSAAYFTGTLAVAAVAFRFGGVAWILLWPASSLFIVSAIYWRGLAAGFGKRDGKIAQPLRLLLRPYTLAARLNSKLWTRRDSIQQIDGGVWIGRAPYGSECTQCGISSMVDVTAELPFNQPGENYRGVPMLDLMVPTIAELNSAVAAIDELKASRPTLVFCALGYSRSATAVVAWMVASGRSESIEAAISRVLQVRPYTRLSDCHRARLAEWATQRS
ncbi:MAG: phosphatase PAP2/dual specificity phosphatase family protein [Bryobacteraceae bacterium]